MPLYEYECDAAHHRFEMIRKFSDPPITTCPTCGSPVHKLFSSPAIQFKGSGFYITDYAKKETTPAGKTEGSKDSGSSDKEPASTTKDEKSGKSETPAKADVPAKPASGAVDKGGSST